MLRSLAIVLISSGVALASQTAPPISIATQARSIQPGELVVLTLTPAGPVDVMHARAFDHDLSPYKIHATRWQVLVGIDLDVAPGAYPVTITAGAAGHTHRFGHTLVVRAKQFPTRHLTVDDSFVNPPAAVLAQIQEDATALAHLWTSSATTRLWTGGFVAPVPQPANSAFGTRSVFNGEPRSPHGGADFASPAGTPVHAPNSGRVVLAKSLYYTGNTVVIDHGLGLFSLFAHLSTIDVHENDMVTIGQLLGHVGATGRVTGPHLHWALRANSARVDPLSLIALLGSN